MKKKLRITHNSYFLIENAQEKKFTEDDVILYLVIEENRYFIEQDSYRYEIGYILNHYSNVSNIEKTEVEDLGYEYFIYQNSLTKDIKSRRLDEFDQYEAFSNENIYVLFYKKNNQIYCQVMQINSKSFQNLCLQVISEELLNEWQQILEVSE